MEKVNQMAKKNLTTLMNLKRSKFLDQNTAYMIDSAYQAAVPSAGHANIVVKEVPLLHKYLKHLLVGQKFDDGSLNSVVMRLRKLRWTPLPGGAAAAIEAAKLQAEKDAAEKARAAAEAKADEAAAGDGDQEDDEGDDSDGVGKVVAPDTSDEKTPDDDDGQIEFFQVHALDAATHAAIGADGLLPVLTKYILNTCRGGRLDTIRVVCRLLQRLKRFRATLVMRVIDELLERIEHGVRSLTFLFSVVDRCAVIPVLLMRVCWLQVTLFATTWCLVHVPLNHRWKRTTTESSKDAWVRSSCSPSSTIRHS